ncbi:MAG: endonuclease/exonuclease/phosphatase family protein [Alphaproteobacteria bacterium]|nr:endonuclease/exonuclease/phosphatase family protein [Alphaproteobacteria bacterium]
MRIATFNMESLDGPPRGRVSLESRIKALRPQLTRLRADVLCLQEVNGQLDEDGGRRGLGALDAVLAGTPYAAYHRAATRSPTGRGVRDRHNLVTVSRYPIVASDEVWNHLVEPPLFRAATSNPPMDGPQPVQWDRPFLYTDLDLGQGRKLVVVNVHLRAPRAAFVPGQKRDSHTWETMPGWAEGFFLATIKAAGQALEVRTFLDRLFDLDEDALVCVTGDFNSTDHEAPVRIIMGDEEDTGCGDFAPRMLTAAERGLPESQRFSVIHRGRPHMADHILLSPQLMGWLVRVECHNEALHDEVGSPAAVTGAPESYHAPVVAELEPGA